HIPALHVDEIGMTSDKYIPINGTITSLPLHISFDRRISPARWRLLQHLSKSLESQKELGFEQSDIDDLRHLIADTNVMLLGITLLASALHMLFEFLTFKSEVSFWQNNSDLTGLSVRSLFLDMVGQFIIILYLIDQETSLLITVTSGFGVLVALWKCQKAAGFAIQSGSNKTVETHTPDLQLLTIEADRKATKLLGSTLLPFVLAYTLYSLIIQEHVSWYSWLVTSASSAVYAFGFVLMTPQLFLNYKMKSVAHLPWRVLVYKSLNTFIDDLFSFIIRMPTMARISCFRDDIVFFIYLYQRWLYPVDTSRPVEGGGDAPQSTAK
ncbi:cleft lip and palate transmembrane 1, partial [Fragilariopsis cylindrus CCMP1102]